MHSKAPVTHYGLLSSLHHCHKIFLFRMRKSTKKNHSITQKSPMMQQNTIIQIFGVYLYLSMTQLCLSKHTYCIKINKAIEVHKCTKRTCH